MTDPGTDPLTPRVQQIIDAGAFDRLVVDDATPPRAQQWLGGVTPEQLLARPVTSPAHAHAMLAGLWLWHDALAECHEIVQGKPENLRLAGLPGQTKGSVTSLPVQARGPVDRTGTPNQPSLRDAGASLSFWHAIMHRREGDFSNSQYWYAKCGNHPVLAAIGQHAGTTINSLPADKSLLRVMANGWDPDAFVDLVADVHRRSADPRLPAVVALQQIEWRLLFDHCTREAVA